MECADVVRTRKAVKEARAVCFSTRILAIAPDTLFARGQLPQSGTLASGLTSFVVDVTFRIMGDKSPKAVHKQAAQKQVKAKAANQKKSNAASVKQIPKPK
jgi:hypothetical protein